VWNAQPAETDKLIQMGEMQRGESADLRYPTTLRPHPG
jgi:hypothetical protein